MTAVRFLGGVGGVGHQVEFLGGGFFGCGDTGGEEEPVKVDKRRQLLICELVTRDKMPYNSVVKIGATTDPYCALFAPPLTLPLVEGETEIRHPISGLLS